MKNRMSEGMANIGTPLKEAMERTPFGLPLPWDAPLPSEYTNKPEQEPVARSDAYDMIDRFLQNNLNSDADYAEYSKALDSIYTTPPKRKPLTKAQVLELWEQTYVQRGSTGIEFARAIEAAHGIKEKNT